MRAITEHELNRYTEAPRGADAADLVAVERGEPHQRISSVHGADTTLAQLEREGRYTPPSLTPAPWPRHPGGRTYTAAEADALLDETRGDH